MAAEPLDSEKARKAGVDTHATTVQDQPTTGQAPGTKKSTGTPMPEHPAATRVSAGTKRVKNTAKEIRFKIEHTQVGAHANGAEVTQEQLGVDDIGLERLLELEAVTPVLFDPTAEENDDAEAEEEE